MKKYTDKQLKNKLDEVVRQILHKTAKKQCFVCNRYTDWFNPKTNRYGLQVGHYVSRKIFYLRWDLDNVEPVCSSCNWIHNNNPIPHTQAIIKKYGQKRIDYLEKKLADSRLKAKTFTYDEKVELLEKLTKQLEQSV